MMHDFQIKPMIVNVGKQQGMALIVSLVLLVAMTLVGIATLSSTRLNERVASNTQQKAITFEVAESSIATVWTAADLLGSVEDLPPGVYDDPDPVAPVGMAVRLSADFDQSNALGKNVDINASVTIQYCGEQLVPVGTSLSADESSVRFAGALFDVNGVAEISGSHARSDHRQRGYVIRPQTGRTGDCVTPGI